MTHTSTTLDPETLAAWERRNARVKKAGRYWKPDDGMLHANSLALRARYRRLTAAIDVEFYDVMARIHGEKAFVEIRLGELSVRTV